MATDVEKLPPPRHVCSVCGEPQDRANLTVKRASFLGFGRNGKLLRSRVVGWLCESCRDKDADWRLDTKKGGIPKAPKVKS
jgi:hypothetical protein